MLRILALVALAVLFAVAVGCGSPSQDSPESVASPPAETALELLQRSHRIMASVGSFRARTTIEGASMGHELEVSSETDVGANGWTHTLMSVRGTGEAGGEATEIERVLTGQHAYTKIPGEGSAWVRTGLGALPELGLPSQSRIDPLGFYKGLFPTGVGLPLEAYSVKSAGLRRIFGVKTEHLTVDLDFQQAWAALSQEQQQRLAQSLGSGPQRGRSTGAVAI